MALCLALLLGCQSGTTPFAEAVVIDSLEQAIGGPTANARVGDYLLQNDKIRVIIEQGGTSFHPADVGGTIIDMDLYRSERAYRGGKGLDHLGQIAPIANLSTAQATRDNHVRITRSRQGAEVTAATQAEPVFKILKALTILLSQRFVESVPDFRMYTEYELRPGEQFLRVRTTVGFDVPFCSATPEDGCNSECDDILYDDDCECPDVPSRCESGVEVMDAQPLPDRPSASILDIVLGDLPRPLGSGTCITDADCDTAAMETCVDVTARIGGEFRVCRKPDSRDGGVFFGDLLIFGGNLTPFVRGIGYDTETDIRRLFDRGDDTLAQPLNIDGVFATGQGVSYGYASPTGNMLVPIFQGPFSMGATHAASCPTSQPGCLTRKLVRFERWLAVGEGDVSSAQEPIARALGQPLGEVSGAVTWIPSSTPASGAAVYALVDPRAIPCEGDCEAACPLPAGEAQAWTLEALMAANRCRSKGPGFEEGTAQIASYALTDVGTDPVKDGDYRMVLAPGRYILVAVDEHRARSTLMPIEVSEGKTVSAPLGLPEPGAIEYAIFDERGELSPGRVTVGRSLAHGACKTDGECDAGELCQAGACAAPWDTLLPLEMGGSRPVDGVLLTDITATGRGRIELPPGDYELLFSRGPHHSIDRQRITVSPGVAADARGSVERVVDRDGWVVADFHVHGTRSMDSGVPLSQRIIGFLAEDYDMLSSSDHDWLTRYAPLIEELGLSDRLSSQVGVEITTQEYGHYIAFPTRYQAYDGGERVTSNGTVQWRGSGPGEIMAKARAELAGDLPVLIDIPHPYDYFDLYLLDPITMEPQSSLLGVLNPVLDPSLFSGDFEAMELVNSTAYFRMRRATLGEIRSYSTGLGELVSMLKSGAISSETYRRQAFDLSIEALRERMHRDQGEQDAFLAGEGADIGCFCGADIDCAPGLTCDAATMTCLAEAQGGAAPPATGLCARFRGVIDDWFNMLNRGVVRTGVSGSDVHEGENGTMRTFLRTDGTTPPYLGAGDIYDAIVQGRAVVSNGPMVHFRVNDGEVGDIIEIPRAEGEQVVLSVRVEKADWYDVDRIEVYRNGKLIHWAQGCESTRGEPDPHEHACIPTGDGVVTAWDERFADLPREDSWYVVLVYGIDGRSLAPVYHSVVLAAIGVPELTQRIYDIIPALREFRNPRYPSQMPLFPFAYTNPIWVDVGGDGWTPPESPPSWCKPGRDFGCQARDE